MAANMASGARVNRWRPLIWGTASALLLLPLVAMRLGADGVHWTGSDFAVMGALLALACGTYELGAWMSGNVAYRAAFGIAVLAGFLLVWINLAVGIIGSESDPANLLFAGVLAVGAIGALVARFRPRGMARALVAMAVVQALVPIAAFAMHLGASESRVPLLGLTVVFIALWLASAGMFRQAALAEARGNRD